MAYFQRLLSKSALLHMETNKKDGDANTVRSNTHHGHDGLEVLWFGQDGLEVQVRSYH